MAGALAREFEQAVPHQRLVRLTADLIRPIPFDGFRIDVEVTRESRSIATAAASLADADGKVAANATALFIVSEEPRDLPGGYGPVADLAEATPGGFPIRRAAHDLPFFTDGIEPMLPPGEDAGPGPTTLWMKTAPILADEDPSPFQRVCPLSDCGNAISRPAEPWEYRFLNADLTVALHREPEGEWFGSQSVSRWEPDGIGMSDSLLFDQRGPVGRAVQNLVIRPW